MITFDIEARQWNKVVGVGLCDYNNGEYYFFRDMERFIEAIMSMEFKDVDRQIWGHYAGLYDNKFILEEALKQNIEHKIHLLNNRIVISLYRNKRHHVTFCDSGLLMPHSLHKLTHSYDVKHKKLKYDDFDHKDDAKMQEYLMHDCLGLAEVLIKFRAELQKIARMPTIKFRRTLPANALMIYKKKFSNHDIYKYISPEIETSLLRPSYAGGRTEVFKRRGKNLFYYDVNSLYPAVMARNFYPVGSYKVTSNPQVIKDCLNKGLLGIIETKVGAPYQEIPFLFMKTKQKLMFPYGRWSGCYTTPEIKYAESLGYKFTPKRAIFWTQRGKIFTKYVNHFYGYKQNATGAKKEIAKLLLNSLYGKFGQRRKLRRVKYRHEIDDDCLIDYLCIDEARGIYSDDYEFWGNRNIQVQVSAFVTGYARIYMHRLIKEIGEPHVYYMDTDSLITDRPFSSERISHALGDLKLEHHMNEGVFIAPKTYGWRSGDNIFIKIKGVPRELLKSVSLTDLENVITGDSLKFSKDRIVGFLEQFKRRDTQNFTDVIKMTRTVTGEYDKRIVAQKDTKPVKVDL